LSAITPPASAGTAVASRACCIEFDAAKPSPQTNDAISARVTDPVDNAQITAPASNAPKKISDVLSAPIRPTSRVAAILPRNPATPKTAKQVAISAGLAKIVRDSNGRKESEDDKLAGAGKDGRQQAMSARTDRAASCPQLASDMATPRRLRGTEASTPIAAKRCNHRQRPMHGAPAIFRSSPCDGGHAERRRQ
jgi:hypothetical protein